MRAESPKKNKRNVSTKPIIKPKHRQPAQQNTKIEAAISKLSDKVAMLSKKIVVINVSCKNSVSKLNGLITRIKVELDESIAKINVGNFLDIHKLQKELDALKEENSNLLGQIDECAKNVAKLYAAKNASTRHERHSGTRASPFGKIADEGIAGMVLPGSFESNKR